MGKKAFMFLALVTWNGVQSDISVNFMINYSFAKVTNLKGILPD